MADVHAKRVLVYTDAAQFGGHEAMTLRGIEGLASRGDVSAHVGFYEGNGRFALGLDEIAARRGNLTLHPLGFCSRALQALRSLVSVRRVRHIQALMRKVSPDVVVVSQGRIESGSAALLAASREGFRTVSYIPMAHPLSLSGRQVAVQFRERLNRWFYGLPDKFITISEGNRAMLLDRGARGEIVVVRNCVTRFERRRCDREQFRKQNALDREDYVVAVVGRIDFRQKGQDFAVECTRRFQRELRHYKFVFIGDGPDRQKLGRMISDSGLGGQLLVLPWDANVARIYAGIDLLLIPSRYEGVPLVMLEAMLGGIPVAASDVDGMAECLPRDWLFPFGDGEAFVKTLARIRGGDMSSTLQKNQHVVADAYNCERFGPRFADAVLS